MCGIAAIYGSGYRATAARMLARLRHRGPDHVAQIDRGEQGWLGHTRLSIMDIAGGSQPFRDGAVSFVCNGEIYNDAEIRDELGRSTFATRSDNESALRLLIEQGPAALARLRGMWALCATGPEFFLAARDPLGIKPLYWARTEGAVLFASEMKAFDEATRPLVEAFPPGCYWTPGTGLVRFADPVAHTDPALLATIPREEWISRTREVLVESIRRHMMADVEVGVFLSGGLDSSIVAAVAARYVAESGRRLPTFAVGTRDSGDLAAARAVAEHIGSEHHEAIFDATDARHALEDVIGAVESFDPSLIRSSVPNWFLAQLAARHVKVVLTGEGADELFAGYSYYHADHADPAALQAELVRSICELHGLNLQRCDRVTMAHGLEARVPFLDQEVIRHSLALPAAAKTTGPGQMEKQLLREAFAGWLPESVLWRRKEQFGDGSGAADVLADAAAVGITEADLAAQCDVVRPPLRSTEELAYYRIYADRLPGLVPERTLTRFAET